MEKPGGVIASWKIVRLSSKVKKASVVYGSSNLDPFGWKFLTVEFDQDGLMILATDRRALQGSELVCA